ncbi:CYIR protein, partial [Plasmodium cynomolgi strain B]
DEVLEGLPSHNIYKYFNENKNIGNNYDKDCEIKINDKTEYPEFKEICKNFAKKLEDILRNVHGKETINYCMLLKYWVYEQIKKVVNLIKRSLKYLFLRKN